MTNVKEKDFNKFVAKEILEPLSAGECRTNDVCDRLAIGMYAPINVSPMRGYSGKRWGFDRKNKCLRVGNLIRNYAL